MMSTSKSLDRLGVRATPPASREPRISCNQMSESVVSLAPQVLFQNGEHSSNGRTLFELGDFVKTNSFLNSFPKTSRLWGLNSELRHVGLLAS